MGPGVVKQMVLPRQAQFKAAADWLQASGAPNFVYAGKRLPPIGLQDRNVSHMHSLITIFSTLSVY